MAWIGQSNLQAGVVSKNLRAPAQLKQTVLVPAGITLVVALAAGFVGRTEALSALTGGLIVSVANAYSTWRVFSGTENESGPQALATLYRAEVGKLLMMGALFAAVFAGWQNVNVLAFVAGCAAALISAPIAVALRKADGNVVPNRKTGTETDG